MKAIEINLDDLHFIEKGTAVKLKVGDVIDDLTVVEYCGKEWIVGRSNWEPVYKVECACGVVELRRQRYLLYKRSKTGCCCYQCARQTSDANLRYLRSPANTEKVDLQKLNIDKEHVDKVMNEIWSIRLWETRIKYLSISSHL